MNGANGVLQLVKALIEGVKNPTLSCNDMQQGKQNSSRETRHQNMLVWPSVFETLEHLHYHCFGNLITPLQLSCERSNILFALQDHVTRDWNEQISTNSNYSNSHVRSPQVSYNHI